MKPTSPKAQSQKARQRRQGAAPGDPFVGNIWGIQIPLRKSEEHHFYVAMWLRALISNKDFKGAINSFVTTALEQFFLASLAGQIKPEPNNIRGQVLQLQIRNVSSQVLSNLAIAESVVCAGVKERLIEFPDSTDATSDKPVPNNDFPVAAVPNIPTDPPGSASSSDQVT